jgi:hypothetical protein
MILNYFSLIFAARRIPSLAAQPEDPPIDVNRQVTDKNWQLPAEGSYVQHLFWNPRLTVH